MSLSRVETKKKEAQNKQRHTTNKKRLIWINVALLAIIIVVVSLFSKGEFLINTVKNGVSALFYEEKKSSNEVEATPAELNKANDEQDKVSENGDSISIVPTPVPTPAPTDQQSEDVPQEEARVTLAFVGDILQGEYINTLLKENGYNYPYEKALFSLSSADYTIGNLEMPFTKNGQPVDSEQKRFVFKGDPDALSGLTYGGIDLVSLANNHTLDQGLEGLYDTMNHLDEHGIHYVGAGKDEKEAYTPHTVEINGIKVAFLAASWVLPWNEWKATPYQAGLAETYDATRILKAIETTKEQADIVVLYVHWGEERSTQPEQRHVDMAKKYIDAGADIIVGSHAHVLQGFEQYNGKWVAYNLGNFVFSAYPTKEQADTGVLHASCDKAANCELSFVPMKTIIGQPTPVDGEERTRILSHLESISLEGVKINEDGTITASSPQQQNID